jgi:hypothetical protein
MPDTKAISCNMRNFQLARIICESKEDNMLVKLRTEDTNPELPSVLDGDVVVVVSSFTNDRVNHLPPMRSVSFVEDDGNQSQRHFATPLTDEILRNAITWLVGDERSDSVTWTSTLDGFQQYLNLLSSEIPDDMSTDKLVRFIKGHRWTNSTMSTKITQIVEALRPFQGGEVRRNSPLVPLFNEERKLHDGYHLQSFIHENLANETKIVIHMIDGIHRVTALDCALVGFDPNNRSEDTVGQALPQDMIELPVHCHTSIRSRKCRCTSYRVVPIGLRSCRVINNLVMQSNN